MANRAEMRHYFVEGLTARGYISLLPNMMEGWQRTYVLLGGPGTGKSTMMEVIGLELLDRGYEVDFFRSAHEPDSMAGFFLPDAGVGMIDAMEVAPQRWRAPQVIEQFIDLGVFCNERELERQRVDITAGEQRLIELQLTLEQQLINVLNNCPGKPYYSDSAWPEKGSARFEHRRNAVDAKGPWTLAQRVLQHLQKSVVTPCFLHGLSSEGWINLTPHFLADSDLIILEGEDTLPALNWVLREAQYLGQVIRIVLHPLNPDQVIGIVFPERNLAIWQGNPQELQDQNLDAAFEPQLKESLAAWRKQRSLLKNIYSEAMDFGQVDRLREEILRRILCDLEQFIHY